MQALLVVERIAEIRDQLSCFIEAHPEHHRDLASALSTARALVRVGYRPPKVDAGKAA